jgi:hypothetical protein
LSRSINLTGTQGFGRLMATASELIVREQLVQLLEVVRDQEGWELAGVRSTTFRLGLPAKDKSMFWLVCDADSFPTFPPIWRWCDARGEGSDAPQNTPKPGQGSFLHSAGVICAPWNRLAYKAIDPRGPHGEWSLGDWTSNANTGECKTLAAMAIRIAVELQTHYSGRVAERLDAVA